MASALLAESKQKDAALVLAMLFLSIIFLFYSLTTATDNKNNGK